MGWLERIFDDDPEPSVAQARMLEAITANPLFEHHRRQTKRQFPARLDFPSVSTPADALGERLGIALRLITPAQSDEFHPIIATLQARIQLAANVLLAPIVLWPTDEIAAAVAVPWGGQSVSTAMLPADATWWTYQDSIRVLLPDAAEFIVDGRLVQRDDAGLTWVDIGARDLRLHVDVRRVRLEDVPKLQPAHPAAPMYGELAHLARRNVVLADQTPDVATRESRDTVYVVTSIRTETGPQ